MLHNQIGCEDHNNLQKLQIFPQKCRQAIHFEEYALKEIPTAIIFVDLAIRQNESICSPDKKAVCICVLINNN